MAKAKYRIGQLVKFSNEDAEQTFIFGEITGVITQKTGYSYQLEDSRTVIEENKVLTAYVPTKTKTTRKPGAARKTKKAALLQTEATQ